MVIADEDDRRAMRAARRALGATRNGQANRVTDWATWDEYVASWPSWREFDACPGVCVRAWVCGRAGLCAEAHPLALVWALARLSAQLRLRPPTHTADLFYNRERHEPS